MCHLRGADLQPQGLIKLQFRDRLCIRTRGVQTLQQARSCGTLHLPHPDARHPLQAACISDIGLLGYLFLLKAISNHKQSVRRTPLLSGVLLTLNNPIATLPRGAIPRIRRTSIGSVTCPFAETLRTISFMDLLRL